MFTRACSLDVIKGNDALVVCSAKNIGMLLAKNSLELSQAAMNQFVD